MYKVIIKGFNKYSYYLEKNNVEYKKHFHFYSKYKPQVGDTIYLDEKLFKEINQFYFDEVYDTKNLKIEDIIKVVSKDKEYYFQRRYG